jgi:IS30 family transposase
MAHCYSQLTLADRRRLFHLRERKVSVAEIARQLGRSTIYRDLKRNAFHDREFTEYSGYYSGIANDMSKECWRRLRRLRRVTAHELACERRAKLRKLVRFSHVRQSVINRIMHG